MALGKKDAILGRYLPLNEAGKGGFATVYVAKDLLMQRKVAIKEIELSEYESFRAGLVRDGLLDGEQNGLQNGAQNNVQLAAENVSQCDLQNGTQCGTQGSVQDSSQGASQNDAQDGVYDTAASFAQDAHAAAKANGGYSPYVGTPTQNLYALRPDGTHPTISLLSDEEDDDARELEKRYLEQIPGLDEARTAATLNDQSIVTVYDCQIDENKVYLIMEYVEGMTLSEFIERFDGDLTLDIIAAIVGSIGQALTVAHSHGVLHFDIKPDNVLIDENGVVKVTDFGLAALEDSQGQGHSAGGTIGYMPLEQMCQQDLDARTDEWALASIAYELLVGENPFDAPDLELAKAAVTDQELLLPSLMWDDLSEDIDDILFDALDPEMDNRYPTVAKFVDDLMHELGDKDAGQKEIANLVAHANDEIEEDEEDESENHKRGFFAWIFGGKSNDNSSSAKTEPQRKVDKSNERGLRTSQNAEELDLRHAKQGQIDFNDGTAAGGEANGSEYAGEGGTAQQHSAKYASPGVMETFKDAFHAAPATRVLSAVLTLAISVFSLWNIPATSGLDNPKFWIISLIFAILAAVKPNAGALFSFGAFATMLIASGNLILGVVFTIALLAWWMYVARTQTAASQIGMLFPVLGSFGFSPVAAIFSGFYTSVPKALATSAFGSFVSIVCASFGARNLFNWQVFTFFVYNKSIVYTNLFQVLSSPFTWCIIASWLICAVVFALCCLPNKRWLSVIGAILVAAVLMVGVWFAYQFAAGATGMVPGIEYLSPVVFAAAAAIFAAAIW